MDEDRLVASICALEIDTEILVENSADGYDETAICENR